LFGRSLGDWDALFGRLRSFVPVMVVVFCIYWLVHVVDALRGPKPELVDLRNPIARAVQKRFPVQ
ncbi:MAG: hypothetical protein WAM53_06255, partial [Terrimicrobiaceae bacterium]